ncbi:MAG: hypothetical protein DSY55_02695 [Clostridia bacterium]|nr:MAG: hypothetical protein DSY55_02695 [Clostridia bacterium]
MWRKSRFLMITGLLLAAFILMQTPALAAGGGTSICDPDGVQSSGAVYRICMPAGDWNGDLVIYAHGYVSPFEPLAIPEDQLTLPDGSSLIDMITGMGYAFATTSYATNGLAIPQGVQDVTDLVAIFAQTKGEPAYVYLTGPSEGGLVTALGAEQHPDVFDGALSTCGPVGDFQKQTDFFGDFRVAFDYFFPGVLPPRPIDIPGEVTSHWDDIYEPAISNALAQDPHATRQLFNVTRAAYDPTDPATMEKTTTWALWYNAFATNDATAKLGGQPYDNSHKIYFGSDDDLALNAGVQRFHADPQARLEIQRHYQTSGNLKIPIVTMHNLLDPIVPYWHEPLYRQKTLANGAFFSHINIPIFRYGHCNFTTEEVLAAFGILVFRVEGHVIDISTILPNARSRTRVYSLMRRYRVPAKHR